VQWDKQFFKEKDIILAETGTSAFGILNVPFPSTARCLGEWRPRLRVIIMAITFLLCFLFTVQTLWGV
jgi:hypothetical protein